MTSSRGRHPWNPWLFVATGPLLAAAALSLFVVTAWALGGVPFAATPVLTLSEAAATRDAGEVLRLIEQDGADPNRPYPVRAGILRDEATSLLPLEAAVLSRRAEIVRLLLRHGAAVSAEEGRRLICVARAANDGDVAGALAAATSGLSEAPSCEAVAR